MDNTGSPITTPEPSAPVKKESGFGPMSAIVIILVLLVLGGIYYFMASVDGLENEGMTSEETIQNDVAALEAQGSSDELAAIEADLNSTDLSGLDEASAGFEGELQAQ